MAKKLQHCHKYSRGKDDPARDCAKYIDQGIKACLDCEWYAGLKIERGNKDGS